MDHFEGRKEEEEQLTGSNKLPITKKKNHGVAWGSFG